MNIEKIAQAIEPDAGQALPDLRQMQNQTIGRRTPINLDNLIAAITPDNLHSKISTGRPVGNEIW